MKKCSQCGKLSLFVRIHGQKCAPCRVGRKSPAWRKELGLKPKVRKK